ncbi:MAG: hypothetical protein KKC11_05215 [Candidatus Omnitrophica bacterium]|nr:hypothetical protein [Candidatus Omnitrophota bacterium]MBU0878104.1 hypothetical protein [Candidatus Omnitrophota bacterium]MBU1133491.1 hypothetical protein [Candidatus Omnitrophota bacterium]MBU1809673.1 hypothetical protein [Candidatus Omnitrophota bacterium]
MNKRLERISRHLKNLVLKEKRKSPYLGVRAVAALLKEKYKVDISKSAVHSILSSQGIKEKKGRKQSLLMYRKQEIEILGLLLLRCIDSEVGLFEHIAGELGVYFAKVEQNLLRKIIMLVSFSSFCKEDPRKKCFLRTAGFYTFPSRKIDYFSKRIRDCKPAINLQGLRKNLNLVSTVKFYFENNDVGYCDGRFSTFWDSPCYMRDFFAPIRVVKRKINWMLKNKVVMVNYTKSFDYLSPLILRFANGLISGLKKIELLTEKEEVLEELRFTPFKPDFFFGYYPKILSKGIVLIGKQPRFKKLSWLGEDIFYVSLLTKFLQPKEKQGVTFNNVLIAPKKKFLPFWGLVTNKKQGIEPFLKQYLLYWPYMEKSFSQEMEIMEKFYSTKLEKKDLSEFIPQTIVFEEKEDFARIGEILASIFNQRIGEIELKSTKGKLILGKDFCKIMIRSFPAQIKKKFNDACLYLDEKRAFLV